MKPRSSAPSPVLPTDVGKSSTGLLRPAHRVCDEHIERSEAAGSRINCQGHGSEIGQLEMRGRISQPPADDLFHHPPRRPLGRSRMPRPGGRPRVRKPVRRASARLYAGRLFRSRSRTRRPVRRARLRGTRGTRLARWLAGPRPGTTIRSGPLPRTRTPDSSAGSRAGLPRRHPQFDDPVHEGRSLRLAGCSRALAEGELPRPSPAQMPPSVREFRATGCARGNVRWPVRRARGRSTSSSRLSSFERLPSRCSLRFTSRFTSSAVG